MKKIISFLLVLALCFSLCACGGSSVEEPSENGSPSTIDTPTKEEPSYANHPLFQFLYGQWELTNPEDAQYNPYSSVTINEDGSCVVDGQTGTWSISAETTDNNLFIDLYVGDTHVGGAVVWGSNTGFGAYHSNGAICPGVWENSIAVVPDGNDIILTEENWRNYFELKTEEEYSRDAFDEIERIHIYQYIQLKEEYASQLLTHDVAVEMTGTLQRLEIIVSEDGSSYTLGSCVEESELTPEIRELDYNHKISVFGNNYINVADNLDPESSNSKYIRMVPSIDHIVMLRIKGTLYLKNE